ncbi:polysaccharide biosynthesis/export family protein [Gemmatirosa kalamazoonensis]|uniref:polysaccharide biosynthesis/export family protein n=1 Tax=Gemmatirosa kalamazoonensis TaxID=861299 RepID=UPI0004B260D4|nr:polysaccharide biosynthesis/export family protein [Gemmatirosa kalamazoonensis]
MASTAAVTDDSVAVAARRAAQVAIAVGDRVTVRVWREPGYSDSLTVDDRGEVVLPRLGPMRVAGRTISSLQDTLRSRYAEYLRNPSVAVTVYRRVGVQGEVKKPNLYFVDATMTLREVIALAGGITENGNPDHVTIVRGGQPIPLGKWTEGGPASVDLRSGDQVVVGRRSWLSRNVLAVVSTAGLVMSVLLPVLRNNK